MPFDASNRPPNHICGVTVLRATGAARATKRWEWRPEQGGWSKTSYSAGALFRAAEYEVASLSDLVSVLDAARRDPGRSSCEALWRRGCVRGYAKILSF